MGVPGGTRSADNPLGPSRACGALSFYQLTHPIGGVRTNDTEDQIEPEADRGKPEQRHRESDEAAEQPKHDVQAYPSDDGEDSKSDDRTEHPVLLERTYRALRLNLAQGFGADRSHEAL